MVAGHVDLMFLEMGSAFQLHKAGRAKVLAISSRERAAQMADVATFAEGGLPAFRSDTWNAIVAPPRTPPALVAKLNATINRILASADVKEHFATLSMQPVGGPASDLAELIQAETRRWGDVIRAAGITAN